MPLKRGRVKTNMGETRIWLSCGSFSDSSVKRMGDTAPGVHRSLSCSQLNARGFSVISPEVRILPCSPRTLDDPFGIERIISEGLKGSPLPDIHFLSHSNYSEQLQLVPQFLGQAAHAS